MNEVIAEEALIKAMSEGVKWCFEAPCPRWKRDELDLFEEQSNYFGE